jgi:ubiquinone/menaquinone biosynthesis C-methylase UbiE
VSEWLIEQLAPQPGQVVLELAAGPGETGFLAAERVGSTGKLLSTDITPGMVEAARRGALARGLSNVECRVVDAQHIDLADHSVDAVLCRFALMLMPDPERAVREIHRVLRAGGRVSYAVFGAADRNPWIALFAEAIRACGHAIPDDPFGPGGRFFSLADPERNRKMLLSAGFTDLVVDEIDEPRRYADFEEYWGHHTHATGPIAAVASTVSTEQTRRIQQRLQALVAPFRHGAEYLLPSHVVVASASR